MPQTLADITDLEWAAMAETSELSGPQLKKHILQGDEGGSVGPGLHSGAITLDGLCQTTPFTTALTKAIRCRGLITLCGPASHWTGSILIRLQLYGLTLGSVAHTFDAQNDVEFSSLTLPILRTRFATRVRRDRWCFAVKGSFGQLTPTGWDDQQINRTLFCFGEI